MSVRLSGRKCETPVFRSCVHTECFGALAESPATGDADLFPDVLPPDAHQGAVDCPERWPGFVPVPAALACARMSLRTVA